jgi:hypothetical protein
MRVHATEWQQPDQACCVQRDCCRDVSMSYGLCDESSGVRHKQQQLAAKEFSAGVIAYYWSVNRRLDMLCHHNVFLSGRTVPIALKRNDCTRCAY